MTTQANILAAMASGDFTGFCKTCVHWRGCTGSRSTSTVGWCALNQIFPGTAPNSHLLRTKSYDASGVVNGRLTLIADNIGDTAEYPATTDLQSCSAWEQAP